MFIILSVLALIVGLVLFFMSIRKRSVILGVSGAVLFILGFLLIYALLTEIIVLPLIK